MCSNAAVEGRRETLLIHGGSSGIGTMAIQLAKRSARDHRDRRLAGKADACQARRRSAINYKTQDFVAEVKALTGGTARISSSTWFEATTSRKITMPPRSRAASSRSPFSAVRDDRQFRQADGQAVASYRIDAAAAFGGRQGRDGQRHRGQVLPLMREGRFKPLIDSGSGSNGSQTRTGGSKPANIFAKLC